MKHTYIHRVQYLCTVTLQRNFVSSAKSIICLKSMFCNMKGSRKVELQFHPRILLT